MLSSKFSIMLTGNQLLSRLPKQENGGLRSTAAPAGNAGVSAPEGCLPRVQLSKRRLGWREAAFPEAAISGLPDIHRGLPTQLVRGNQKSRDSLVG